MLWSYATRGRWIPVVVLIVTVAAIAGVIVLEGDSDASRRSQVRVGSLNQSLTDLKSAPLRADRTAGGTSTPAQVRAEIRSDQATLAGGLAGAARCGERRRGHSSARAEADGARGPVFTVPKRIADADAKRAQRTRLEGAILVAVAMLALFGEASRVEASTDVLTGLGNRRALTDELAAALSSVESGPESVCDAFDAITSDRPHRAATTPEAALSDSSDAPAPNLTLTSYRPFAP